METCKQREDNTEKRLIKLNANIVGTSERHYKFKTAQGSKATVMDAHGWVIMVATQSHGHCHEYTNTC